MPTSRVGPADCSRWLGILGKNERERAARFRWKSDHREFVAAHMLLRRMLNFYLDESAESWQFVDGPFGKPKIDALFCRPDIDFNISHTRGLVAAALVSNALIGVDVEKIEQVTAEQTLAETIFSRPEVEILRNTPLPQRTARFFELWTLKESYLKATGNGLAAPLDSFAFTLAPLSISFLTDIDDRPQRWRFKTLRATSQHALAVAVANPKNLKIRIVYRAIDPQDI
jgi:4'-phosphopantetheinyl transferase